MYALTSENLTGLGSPMGTERTWNNWVKYFKTEKKAKEYAEKDYRFRFGTGEPEKVIWKNGSTQDLGFVMYHIKKIKIEA